jgi:hypothetical protein
MLCLLARPGNFTVKESLDAMNMEGKRFYGHASNKEESGQAANGVTRTASSRFDTADGHHVFFVCSHHACFNNLDPVSVTLGRRLPNKISRPS